MPDESAIFDGDRPSDYWEPYKKRGLYTVSQAASLLAWRHVTVPSIVIGRPMEDLLTDEELARALGFADCDQIARTFEVDKKFRAENGQVDLFDEYRSVQDLWRTRVRSSQTFTSLSDNYRADIIASIRAGRLRTIDRARWESGAPYLGDPADDIWSAKLLVLASQINELEKERGSLLPPIGLEALVTEDRPSLALREKKPVQAAKALVAVLQSMEVNPDAVPAYPGGNKRDPIKETAKAKFLALKDADGRPFRQSNFDDAWEEVVTRVK